MDPPAWLERLPRTIAYLLLGAVGTAALALALLRLGLPLQAVLYDATYLLLGPSGATKAAILGQFVAAGVVAISVPALLGEYLGAGGRNLGAFARTLGAMALLLVAFVAASLAGLAPFSAVVVVLAASAVAVPVALRYGFGVRSGGVPAFVGGIPVLLVLLLAAGFGLGWGWGYVLVAEEVPASAADDAAVADFGGVPAVRADLFAPSRCERGTDGARRCLLQLRGYAHETAAARFLARHGARCPYRSGGAADGGSVLVRHEGALYRLTCSPHGD